jgi:hypothetical protein
MNVRPSSLRWNDFADEDEIFVFGSNLGGIHGRGSALHARRYYGALQGVGTGRQGHAFAIPTKDRYLRVLPLATIEQYVKEFLHYASHNTEFRFEVVEIGCGLAGYTPADIAPFFKGFSSNVNLPVSFRKVLLGS